MATNAPNQPVNLTEIAEMFNRYANDPWEFVANHIKTFDGEKGAFRYFAYFSGEDTLPTFRDEIKKLIYTIDEHRRARRTIPIPDLLIEKSRQMYATTAILAYLTWCLLFVDNCQILVTSEKATKIDKKGDYNSLLGRIEQMITMLPQWLQPDPKDLIRNHLSIGIKSRNSLITGDAGTNPGRAGQYDIIFNDEFAFQEFSETKLASEFAAAKGVILYVSTPDGKNNAFYRLRQAAKAGTGKSKLITWHWSLRRTQAWYEKKKGEYIDAATLAQEQDISYEGSRQHRAFPHFITATNTMLMNQHNLPAGENFLYMDYGYNHPTVILFVRKCKDNLYIYDMHAASETPMETHVSETIRIMDRWGLTPRDFQYLGDPSGASRSRETGDTSYKLFEAEVKKQTGVSVTITQANNRVKEGIESVNQAFRTKYAVVSDKLTLISDALNEAHYALNSQGEVTGDKYVDDWTADYCDVVRYAIATTGTVKPVLGTRVRNSSLSTFTGL